jgi:hypothetical protein
MVSGLGAITGDYIGIGNMQVDHVLFPDEIFFGPAKSAEPFSGKSIR